ncbi:taste receptor type 2 member 119-like [Engystomops pustulosus]|uniref:taste receptor type 2 member 119-like n=1 Tax=Engystomops pustulosus TaxID=76066 RepID=UPI003AFA6E75
MSPSAQYIKDLCLFIAGVISYITGLTTNLFIVGVSVVDRLIRRPLTPADLLITAIATSRIIFQLNIFVIIFFQEYSAAYSIAFSSIGNFSIYCNIWCSVLLSVFYSLKIGNFHNFLHRCLKLISRRVLLLILGSVLLSIAYTSVLHMRNFMIIPKNSTQEGDGSLAIRLIMDLFLLLWNVLPFLFYAGSSFALLGSLCRHMYRMRREDNVTGRMDAYYKTIKFTIFSFFSFAFYVTINVFGSDFFDHFGSLLMWNCFPLLHSIYIIYMTARLRATFLNILHGLNKCFLPRKCSPSRSKVVAQIN